MMRIAALWIILALAAGPAWAGATRCWVENGALVVPAAFGGVAGDFILDLSAPRSQLHDTVAQEAGILSDSVRRPLRVADERIGALALDVADLDARSLPFVTGISGVIGADALAPFVIDIRFAPCRVTLYRSAPAALAGAVRLRIRRMAGAPAAPAGVSDGAESRRGWFAIDTGSQGARIARAALTRAPLQGVDPESRFQAPAQLRALSIGGSLFEHSSAGLMPDPPPGLDGAIGLAVWSRFHLRLDLRHGWLDLAPSPSWGGTDGGTVRVGLCEIEHGLGPTPDFVSTRPMKGREEEASRSEVGRRCAEAVGAVGEMSRMMDPR